MFVPQVTGRCVTCHSTSFFQAAVDCWKRLGHEGNTVPCSDLACLSFGEWLCHPGEELTKTSGCAALPQSWFSWFP